MDYSQVETEIVNKLMGDNLFPGEAMAFPLPDDLSEYKTAVNTGLVYVVFLGEKADGNQSIGGLSTHVTLSFTLAISSRRLRGKRGVYSISEHIKRILIGYSPTDCGRLNFSEQEFNGYENDNWEHSLIFTCRSLRTQDEQIFLPADDLTNGDEVFYDKKSIDENIHI